MSGMGFFGTAPPADDSDSDDSEAEEPREPAPADPPAQLKIVADAPLPPGPESGDY